MPLHDAGGVLNRCGAEVQHRERDVVPWRPHKVSAAMPVFLADVVRARHLQVVDCIVRAPAYADAVVFPFKASARSLLIAIVVAAVVLELEEERVGIPLWI